jgi:hypothetical protein
MSFETINVIPLRKQRLTKSSKCKMDMPDLGIGCKPLVSVTLRRLYLLKLGKLLDMKLGFAVDGVIFLA